MGNVLLVAPYFPPVNRQASRRAAAMAKYLPACGWRVTVLTSQPVDYGDLMSPEEVRANVGIDEAQIIRKMLPASRPAPRGRLLGKLLGMAEILCLPGTCDHRWPRLVLPELRGRELNVDVIWATSPHWGSLLAASRLGKSMHVPWVADFRDVIDQLVGLKGRGWLARLARWREKSCCDGAAHITTVSEGLADMLRGRYGAPVSVVPNGFDPDWLCEAPKKPEAPAFRIAYTGSIWGSEDPLPVIEAANQLIADGVCREDEIETVFYGCSSESLGGHTSGPLRKPPTFLPKLPLSDVLRAQRDATVLLVLALPGTRGVLTLKLYEYMAAGRPVLAFPREPELDSILRRTGVGVSCDSADELKAVLHRWFQEWKATGDIRMSRNRDEIMKFSRREQAKVLASVLEQVAAKGRR
ncbi:MAG: glycosyltransferase family 4 protein [Planctomycetes bacterium]|nr:glycosyltransferase family 4 protein [Planctomycetota bacterium]